MQPAGCPAAGRPWGDDNRIHASPEPQGPFPRRPRLSARGHPRQGRLRRRHRRPGSARSLTQPARSHEHGTCTEKGGATGPFLHALQTPPHPRNRRPKPCLTPARSFRDEWTGSSADALAACPDVEFRSCATNAGPAIHTNLPGSPTSPRPIQPRPTPTATAPRGRSAYGDALRAHQASQREPGSAEPVSQNKQSEACLIAHLRYLCRLTSPRPQRLDTKA